MSRDPSPLHEQTDSRVEHRPWTMVAVIAATAALAIAACSRNTPFDTNPSPGAPSPAASQISLVPGGMWQYMPGVVPDGRQTDALLLRPTRLNIADQDTVRYSPRSVFNLYGSGARVAGDFRVILSSDDNVRLRLRTQPPGIADEFSYLTPDMGGIDITRSEGKVTVVLVMPPRTGNSPELSAYKPYNIEMPDRIDSPLSISKYQNRLFLIAGDKPFVLPKEAFALFATSENTLWFGLESASERTVQVKSLSVIGENGGKVSPFNTTNQAVVSKPKDSLQNLAEKTRPGFKVGAAIALGPLVVDMSYRQAALGNFGMMTTENAMKMQNIQPIRGQFEFGEVDALIDIAKKNSMAVHAHTLVFGEANPKWLVTMPTDTYEQKKDVENIMSGHVTTIMNRYKDAIDTVDVINEPLAADYFTGYTGEQPFRQHIWYKAMGPDYIEKALHTAHAAAPQAKLFINEFGLESDDKRWGTFLDIVRGLKSRGVPLDGIGFQAHVYDAENDAIDAAKLGERINELAAIGLQARISEQDVSGEKGADWQARQYSSVLKMCIKNSNCTSWTTWGVDNKYNVWDDNGTLRVGKDFLFTNGKPSEAYRALQQAVDELR